MGTLKADFPVIEFHTRVMCSILEHIVEWKCKVAENGTSQSLKILPLHSTSENVLSYIDLVIVILSYPVWLH